MSPIHTKVVTLDGSGAGTLKSVPPMFYVGMDGAGQASNEGGDLGTAQLTVGTAKFVEGDIAISGGAAGGEATIYLLDI